MKRNINKLATAVIGVLLIATIFFAIKASAKGESLVKLENESAQIAEINQELKDQIVSSTSLSQINKEATGMGMIQPEKFIYMSNQGIALR